MLLLKKSNPASTPETAGIVTEIRSNLHSQPDHAEACRITAPFFDAQPGMVGVSYLLLFARQTLREAYPALTLQEIALLFAGIRGCHTARLKQHQHKK